MALNPSVNNSLATMTFGPAWGNGEIPVVATFGLDVLPTPMTQVYRTGTLLGKGANGNLVIYDSTDQATNPLKGVFFDEVASFTLGGPGTPMVEVAINDRPSTMWKKSVLVGANSGTTDIDFLITNGYASVIKQYVNGVSTDFIQFKGMGTGA